MESAVNVQPWYCESPQNPKTERTSNAIGPALVHENSNLGKSTGSWHVNRPQAFKKSRCSIFAFCGLCFNSVVISFMFVISCLMCTCIILIFVVITFAQLWNLTQEALGNTDN